MKHHPECKFPYYGGGMFGCISRCPVRAEPWPVFPDGKRYPAGYGEGWTMDVGVNPQTQAEAKGQRS